MKIEYNSLQSCIKDDCIKYNWNIKIIESLINRFLNNCGNEIHEKCGFGGFWYIEIKKVNENILKKKLKYYWSQNHVNINVDNKKFLTLFIISLKTKQSMAISLPYNVANKNSLPLKEGNILTKDKLELFEHICPVCKNINRRVKKCQCKMISYCSKECQKKDWKNHSQICNMKKE